VIQVGKVWFKLVKYSSSWSLFCKFCVGLLDSCEALSLTVIKNGLASLHQAGLILQASKYVCIGCFIIQIIVYSKLFYRCDSFM